MKRARSSPRCPLSPPPRPAGERRCAKAFEDVGAFLHGRNDYRSTCAARTMAEAGSASTRLTCENTGVRFDRVRRSATSTTSASTTRRPARRPEAHLRAEQGDLLSVLVALHSTAALSRRCGRIATPAPSPPSSLIPRGSRDEDGALLAMQPVLGASPRATPLGRPPRLVRTITRSLDGCVGPLPPLLRSPVTRTIQPSRAGTMRSSRKRPGSYLVPAKWLEAVMVGHEVIENEVARLPGPVDGVHVRLAANGRRRSSPLDVVLDAGILAERSANLVEQTRLPGSRASTTFLQIPVCRGFLDDEALISAFVS